MNLEICITNGKLSANTVQSLTTKLSKDPTKFEIIIYVKKYSEEHKDAIEVFYGAFFAID